MLLPGMLHRGTPQAMSSMALEGRPISVRALWWIGRCRRPLVTDMGLLGEGAPVRVA